MTRNRKKIVESLLCKFRGRTEGGKSVLYCLHLLDIPIPEHKSDSRLERIRTCKSNSACKFQGTWLICQGSDRTLRNRTKIWILRFLFRIESKKFRFDKQNSKRFDIRLRHKWNWSCNLPEPQGAEPKRDKWCFVFLKTKIQKSSKDLKSSSSWKYWKIWKFYFFGRSEFPKLFRFDIGNLSILFRPRQKILPCIHRKSPKRILRLDSKRILKTEKFRKILMQRKKNKLFKIKFKIYFNKNQSWK